MAVERNLHGHYFFVLTQYALLTKKLHNFASLITLIQYFSTHLTDLTTHGQR